VTTYTGYIQVVFVACLGSVLFRGHVIRFNKIIAWLDALGLGAYAVVGVQESLNAGLTEGSAILVGVINAAGGGLLRDVLVRDEPLLFKPASLCLGRLRGPQLFAMHKARCAMHTKYVREEEIAVQVDRTIERVALESTLADKKVRQLEKDREAMASGQQATIARLKTDIATCEKQTDLLLDLRLNEQISEAEYVSKKHTLVNRKAELRGKLEAFEHNRANRFEPAIRFVLEAKDATI
jgi:hypothetical protein